MSAISQAQLPSLPPAAGPRSPLRRRALRLSAVLALGLLGPAGSAAADSIEATPASPAPVETVVAEVAAAAPAALPEVHAPEAPVVETVVAEEIAPAPLDVPEADLGEPSVGEELPADPVVGEGHPADEQVGDGEPSEEGEPIANPVDADAPVGDVVPTGDPVDEGPDDAPLPVHEVDPTPPAPVHGAGESGGGEQPVEDVVPADPAPAPIPIDGSEPKSDEPATESDPPAPTPTHAEPEDTTPLIESDDKPADADDNAPAPAPLDPPASGPTDNAGTAGSITEPPAAETVTEVTGPAPVEPTPASPDPAPSNEQAVAAAALPPSDPGENAVDDASRQVSEGSRPSEAGSPDLAQALAKLNAAATPSKVEELPAREPAPTYVAGLDAGLAPSGVVGPVAPVLDTPASEAPVTRFSGDDDRVALARARETDDLLAQLRGLDATVERLLDRLREERGADVGSLLAALDGDLAVATTELRRIIDEMRARGDATAAAELEALLRRLERVQGQPGSVDYALGSLRALESALAELERRGIATAELPQADAIRALAARLSILADTATTPAPPASAADLLGLTGLPFAEAPAAPSPLVLAAPLAGADAATDAAGRDRDEAGLGGGPAPEPTPSPGPVSAGGGAAASAGGTALGFAAALGLAVLVLFSLFRSSLWTRMTQPPAFWRPVVLASSLERPG